MDRVKEIYEQLRQKYRDEPTAGFLTLTTILDEPNPLVLAEDQIEKLGGYLEDISESLDKLCIEVRYLANASTKTKH